MNKSKMFTHEEKELLITNVESKPCLYNLSSPNYKDKRYADAAWEVIGCKLNRTGTECKEQWTSIRTQKRRLFNENKKTKSGSGREPFIKWEFYKTLSFLEPYFSTGTQSGSLDDEVYSSTEKSDINKDKRIEIEDSNEIYITIFIRY